MIIRDRTYQLLIRQTKGATPKESFKEKPGDVEISHNIPVGAEGLSLMFSVDKNLSKTPNTCEITIRNLAPKTRTEVERDGVRVHLSAGHSGVARLLFVGDVTYARSRKEGTDWLTEIHLGDGTRAIGHARATPRSYKGGTPVIKVVKECAASMGLTLPEEVVNSTELQTQFAAGFAMSGRASDELTRLLAPFGYGWSVQDGRLQILRDNQARNDPPRVISEENGMIGSPVYGKPEKKGQPPTLTVQSILYPELSPGAVVRIDSREVKGQFKIQKAKHSGDLDADDWTTEIEVKPHG